MELRYQHDVILYQDLLDLLDAYAEAHGRFASIAKIVEMRVKLFDDPDVRSAKHGARHLQVILHNWLGKTASELYVRQNGQSRSAGHITVAETRTS